MFRRLDLSPSYVGSAEKMQCCPITLYAWVMPPVVPALKARHDQAHAMRIYPAVSVVYSLPCERYLQTSTQSVALLLLLGATCRHRPQINTARFLHLDEHRFFGEGCGRSVVKERAPVDSIYGGSDGCRKVSYDQLVRNLTVYSRYWHYMRGWSLPQSTGTVPVSWECHPQRVDSHLLGRNSTWDLPIDAEGSTGVFCFKDDTMGCLRGLSR